MKKLILFFSAVYLISLGAFAQTIVITDGGATTFNNGDTIVIAKPIAYMDSTLTVHLYAKNTTNSPYDTECRRYNDDTIPGSVNSFCYGIGCYPPFTNVSEVVEVKSSQLMEIKGEYKAKGHPGASIIRYSVYDISNMSDSAWVYVIFNPNSAVGIADFKPSIKVSKAYPNPAKNIVNVEYEFTPSVGEVKFVISDVLGSTVKNVQLTETSGKVSVNVDDLQNGVYFYSFITESDILITRKLIVRH